MVRGYRDRDPIVPVGNHGADYMIIDVTQSDIDRGERYRTHACPIAHAADRAFGVPCSVMRAHVYVGDDVHVAQLPWAAIDFIWHFDMKHAVQPFTFEVVDPR
jgi:hypothetical protein